MKAKIVSLIDGKSSGDASLDKGIFGLEFRQDILYRVIKWQLAKRQAGTHKTKERGEIQGGRKKPFKQKGTGNARQGSLNAPHMRGGGVAFGPRVRSHSHKLPKKIRQLGLKIALSSKASQNKIAILKELQLKDPKTSLLAKNLESLGFQSVLIIGGEKIDENFSKAAANIKNIDVLPVQGINVYDILRRDNLLLTEEAIKTLEERLNG